MRRCRSATARPSRSRRFTRGISSCSSSRARSACSRSERARDIRPCCSSHLVAQVFTIERIPALYTQAREQHRAAPASRNVSMLLGDGTVGWREYCAVRRDPRQRGRAVRSAAAGRSAGGGRANARARRRPREQTLMLVSAARGTRTEQRDVAPVRFVPLIGTHGWEAARRSGARCRVIDSRPSAGRRLPMVRPGTRRARSAWAAG